jgi:hypothetical protein
MSVHGYETNFALLAPEPAGAVVPAPPTAVEAQTPATDAPTEAAPAAESIPAPATAPTSALPAEVPPAPTATAAPGMSATSGPLAEPDFAAPEKEAPATPAAVPAAVPAPAPVAAVADK